MIKDKLKPNYILDVKGFLCPLPTLRARKKLQTLNVGDVLVVEATDPKSKKDMPSFCEEQGHEYLECYDHEQVIIHVIRKKGFSDQS